MASDRETAREIVRVAPRPKHEGCADEDCLWCVYVNETPVVFDKPRVYAEEIALHLRHALRAEREKEREAVLCLLGDVLHDYGEMSDEATNDYVERVRARKDTE